MASLMSEYTFLLRPILPQSSTPTLVEQSGNTVAASVASNDEFDSHFSLPYEILKCVAENVRTHHVLAAPFNRC